MIGIVLITHGHIGASLLEAARATFYTLPTLASAVCVPNDADLDALLEQASQQVRKVNQNRGVLVLTDILGSSASNLAHRLLPRHRELRVVTGVNLPMLFRSINYAHLNLQQLAQKALSGGNEGIVLSHDTKENHHSE